MSGFIVPAPISYLSSITMKISKSVFQKHSWQIAFILFLDFIFFGFTNASSVAPILLIVGFVLFSLTMYILMYALFSFIQLYGIPIHHKKRLSMFFSIVVGVLIALQSIGELSIRDVFVILPLSCIGYLYVIFASSRKNKIDA